MGKKRCPCQGQTMDRLVQPAVLAILARQELSGYELRRRLASLHMFDGQPPDPTGLYRTLTGMERRGLLASRSAASLRGPRKWLFRMTPDGRKCLSSWRDTLKDYQLSLNEIMALTRRR
jgi:PadR family transcriptional regulator, regulatory protein PadR